jgi:hypothetical protein
MGFAFCGRRSTLHSHHVSIRGPGRLRHVLSQLYSARFRQDLKKTLGDRPPQSSSELRPSATPRNSVPTSANRSWALSGLGRGSVNIAVAQAIGCAESNPALKDIGLSGIEEEKWVP